MLRKQQLIAAFTDLVQAGAISEPKPRELNYLRAYRVVLAALAVLLTFAGYERDWIRFADLHTTRALALMYLAGAVLLIGYGMQRRLPAVAELLLGLVLDIAAVSVAMLLTRGMESTLPLLLLVSLAGASHYLPIRLALGAAAVAVIGMLAAMFSHSLAGDLDKTMANGGAFGMVTFVVAAIASVVGMRARQAEALAARREGELVDLDRLNDLIVQRMRTGVLLLDAQGKVPRMNESALRILGGSRRGEAGIATISPSLDAAWRHWRATGEQPANPALLAENGIAAQSRFLRLFVDRDDLTVVFLDDATLLNERAEALTLDTLGRLSATIAHELRNPLAAIQQAGQLLGESTDLPARDKRLVEIIGKHSQRLERIVRGVLDLARRERARPETICLETWLVRYLDEFRLTRLPEGDELEFVSPSQECEVLFDPVHLEQIVGNLLGNAMNYGRRPDAPLRITVRLKLTGPHGGPELLVADNGHGVADHHIDRLFQAFHTTGAMGTGLGLYLCRQLCEANDADLDYDPPDEYGAGFMIRFRQDGIRGH